MNPEKFMVLFFNIIYNLSNPAKVLLSWLQTKLANQLIPQLLIWYIDLVEKQKLNTIVKSELIQGEAS
jgi:hypothetical protein